MKRCIQVLVVILTYFLAACSADLSSGTYSGSQVNTANKVVYGTIINKRTVTINNQTGVGGIAGAVAGGLAGSALGNSTRTNILGGLGGALAGAGIGSLIDKKLNTQQGYEYIIRVRKGNPIAVTQSHENNLSVGMHVMVIYGDQVRVVPA